VAHRVVCSGPLPAKILAHQSGGQLNTITGCALRYQYLWERVHELRYSQSSEPSLRVLITLPVTLSGVIWSGGTAPCDLAALPGAATVGLVPQAAS